jgi:hypothetical protein
MAICTEINSTKYALQLDADGKPYVLKRYQQSAGGRWYWGIVWAEWHKGRPVGERKLAIARCGFEWRNSTQENLGWYSLQCNQENV